jgi:hydrogenase maturation protease
MIRPLVIGAGNPECGDDAAGAMLVRRLRESGDSGCDAVATSGEMTALLDLFAGRDRVIIVDACLSGGRPGEIHRFDASRAPLPASLAAPSSHGLGVAAGIELARALDQLPSRLRVIAIEGEDFSPGAGVSAAVTAAISAVLDGLAGDLAALASGAPGSA